MSEQGNSGIEAFVRRQVATSSSSEEQSAEQKPTSSWVGLTRINKVDERFKTNQSRDLALRFLEEENETTIQTIYTGEQLEQEEESSKKRKYQDEASSDEEDDLTQRTDTTTAAIINIWAKKQKINEEKDVRLGNVWVMSNARVNVEKASLSDNIVQALKTFKNNPVKELFAVQRAVVPVLVAMSKSGTPGDICIGSPTGSGKTLAYVLPIVEVLSSLKFTKLRAIVVTPTHQLVEQVASVFKSFESCTSLKVKALRSHGRFDSEQAELVDPKTGEVKVDIVIGQPLQILEHIKKTKGFTLEHLRFIVYDEVDTLLSGDYASYVKSIAEAYHNWYVFKSM